MISEIYERLKVVCKENNTNPTSLCIEITGSQGNLATWKKGNIRTDYLIKIAQKFNVTIDYLLLSPVESQEIQHARSVLKDWIKTTNTTVTEMEEKTNTNYATIQVWSEGIGNYFNDKIYLISDMIGCTTDFLLGKDNYVHPSYKLVAEEKISTKPIIKKKSRHT